MKISIRESVKMAFSDDAAAMTDGTSHMFSSLKNINIRSNRNSELLYVDMDEDGALSVGI